MSTSTTSANKDAFTVTTTFKATPEALYNILITPPGLEKWIANKAEVDAQVGGRYKFIFEMPNGVNFSARGTFIAIEPNKMVKQTWESWGPEGRFEGGDAVVTYEIEQREDGIVALHQSETSDSYNPEDTEKLEMSMAGTIDAHERIRVALEC